MPTTARTPDDTTAETAATLPVALRPVRRTDPGALGTDRRAPLRLAEPHPGDQPLETMFVSALRAGDAAASTQLALLIAERSGLAVVYQLMSSCLSDLGSEWAAGRKPVRAERAATHASQAVIVSLRSSTPAPTLCGTVVLATPPGERHTLALAALAHLLQQAGRPVLVVDDLPLEELRQLAAEPGTAAIVLSAHVDLPPAAARRLLAALHQAAPEVLIAAGGPGFPATVGTDLVTDDLDVLLAELELRLSALTQREREVLLAVANGLTNPEIAAELRVAPATVKSHLDHIFAKTRTEHRAAAVACALRQGWIQ